MSINKDGLFKKQRTVGYLNPKPNQTIKRSVAFRTWVHLELNVIDY